METISDKFSSIKEETESHPSTSISSNELIYDPRNIANIGDFALMGEQVKAKYAKTWLEFCDYYDISLEKWPEHDDFIDFFRRKKESGCTSNYMISKKILMPITFFTNCYENVKSKDNY